MGAGRWNATDWNTYSTAAVGNKPAAQVFKSSGMEPDFDPSLIPFRESRDSADNPAATPLVLACDVTDSMGIIAEQLMRGGLDDIATSIQRQIPFPDPHVMVMAVGDATCDAAPLQVTQFEADIRIARQTSRLWMEKGGGLNGGESYGLPYLFAARKIRSDAAKRNVKGYIFTIGDEPTLDVTPEQAKRFLGIDIPRTLTTADCVAMASADFHCFHIVLTQEGYARGGGLPRVIRTLEQAFQQSLLLLDDITRLADTIVAAIRIREGVSKADATAGTSVAVANAIRSLADRASTGGGIVRLS
jgi:hypothetical protein